MGHRTGTGTGSTLAPWAWSARTRLVWQVASTALFALLLVRSVDEAELRDSLLDAEPIWIVPALLLFTGAKYVDSWRWRYLLGGLDQVFPQRALFGAFLIGNFVNNLLPLRLGDVAKIQVLANRYGAPRAGLAASVFIVEASLDGLVFVVFLVAVFTFGDLGALSTVTQGAAFSLAGVALVLFVAAVVLSRTLTTRGAGWSRPLRSRLWAPVARVLADARGGLEALLIWRRTVGAIALSMPAWLIEAGMFALFGEAFGLGLSYPTFVAAMVAANLAVALPIALWNFGPYEALVSGVLIAAGVEPSIALSYAISVHVLSSTWIFGSGVVAMWALNVSPRELLSLRSAAGPGRPHRADLRS